MYCLTNAYKNINIDCVYFFKVGEKFSETAVFAKINKSSCLEILNLDQDPVWKSVNLLQTATWEAQIE